MAHKETIAKVRSKGEELRRTARERTLGLDDLLFSTAEGAVRTIEDAAACHVDKATRGLSLLGYSEALISEAIDEKVEDPGVNEELHRLRVDLELLTEQGLVEALVEGCGCRSLPLVESLPTGT